MARKRLELTDEPKQEARCPDPKCNSTELTPFVAGGMHQVKCRKCGVIHRQALAQLSQLITTVESTVHGPKSRVTRVPLYDRAEFSKLEHEDRGFRDPRKNYLPGDYDE